MTAFTRYELYDAGAAADSGYFWTTDLGQRAANTYITIDAAISPPPGCAATPTAAS